jgi:hypothetical protein
MSMGQIDGEQPLIGASGRHESPRSSVARARLELITSTEDLGSDSDCLSAEPFVVDLRCDDLDGPDSTWASREPLRLVLTTTTFVGSDESNAHEARRQVFETERKRRALLVRGFELTLKVMAMVAISLLVVATADLHGSRNPVSRVPPASSATEEQPTAPDGASGIETASDDGASDIEAAAPSVRGGP